MFNKWLLISLWGGLVALDTTAVLQILISHPLVSCSVVGFLLGNFKVAFLIGVILELIWLNELPVGAAPFSEGNIGATVAAAVAVLGIDQIQRMQMVIPVACLFGILVSAIGGYAVIGARYLNSYLYSRLLESNRLTPARITATHLGSILLLFVGGTLFTALMTGVSYRALLALAPLIPVAWDARLWPMLGAFLGVGCAVLLYLFVSRKNWWLLVMGTALGALFLFL